MEASPAVEPAEALRGLRAAIGAVADLDLAGLDSRTVLGLLRELEIESRRLAAAVTATVDHIDRTDAHAVDGFRTTKSCVLHITRSAPAEAAAVVRSARALRLVPAVAAGYAAGQIPTAHVRTVAKAVTNPRVAEHVEGADALFAEHAAAMDHRCFTRLVRNWERLADADGAEQHDDARHEARTVSLHETFDGSWSLTGRFGALQGAAIAEILRRYDDAEFHADWEAAAELHGTETRAEHLARTPAQRRADAFAAALRRSVATPPDAIAP